jgi:hypothetical protein
MFYSLNGKFQITIQFIILAVVSLIVTGLTYITGSIASYHWHEFLEGAPLPTVTAYATHYGYIVPLMCCLLSILCIVYSIKKHDSTSLLLRLFMLIVVFELIGLAFISWLYFYPSLNITYELM